MENFEMNSYQDVQKRSFVPSSWVKFMGIITIISGALNCLGIISAAIGVPMIIAGLKLLDAHKQVIAFSETNDQNMLSQAFENYNKYFKITGIVWLIGIVLTVLMLVLFGVLIALGLGAAMMQSGGYSPSGI